MAGAIALVALSSGALAFDPDAIVEQSNVEIVQESGHLCAGTVLEIDGNAAKILTAFHCVEELATTKKGNLFVRDLGYAKIIDSNMGGDLALIEAKATQPSLIKRFKAIKVAPLGFAVKRGLHVWCMGNPLTIEGVITEGTIGKVVRNWPGAYSNVDAYVYTGGATYGNSGGALLNDDGDVIGVASFLAPSPVTINGDRSEEYMVGSNYVFFMTIEAIHALIDDHLPPTS